MDPRNYSCTKNSHITISDNWLRTSAVIHIYKARARRNGYRMFISVYILCVCDNDKDKESRLPLRHLKRNPHTTPLKTLSDWLNLAEEITAFRLRQVVSANERTLEDQLHWKGSRETVHEMRITVWIYCCSYMYNELTRVTTHLII